MSDIYFRAANTEDLAIIVALERQAHGWPWSEAQIAQALAQAAQSRFHQVKLLLSGLDLIGYYFLQQVLDEAELLNIAVAPKFQGQGYGRSLMQAMHREAAAGGTASVFLEVRASNQAALKLYQRQGYYITGRRRGYYRQPQPGEDALIMRRDLEPNEAAHGLATG